MDFILQANHQHFEFKENQAVLATIKIKTRKKVFKHIAVNNMKF